MKQFNTNRLYYHSTNNINLDIRKCDEIYFTDDYEYAKVCIQNVYSSYTRDEHDKNGIITAKLSCKNVFDTRHNDKHKTIFKNFKKKYKHHFTLTDDGYVCWISADELIDYIKKQELKFDCILIQDANNKLLYVILNKNKIEIINKEII